MSGNWYRFVAAVVASCGGIGSAYAIWAAPAAPRWLLVISGFFAVGGIAAALLILAVIYVVITEDIRPRLSIGAPSVPLTLSHREASMIGRKRFRQHPVRFWGALTLSNRFVLGFMLLDKPEYIDLKDDREVPA